MLVYQRVHQLQSPIRFLRSGFVWFFKIGAGPGGPGKHQIPRGNHHDPHDTGDFGFLHPDFATAQLCAVGTQCTLRCQCMRWKVEVRLMQLYADLIDWYWFYCVMNVIHTSMLYYICIIFHILYTHIYVYVYYNIILNDMIWYILLHHNIYIYILSHIYIYYHIYIYVLYVISNGMILNWFFRYDILQAYASVWQAWGHHLHLLRHEKSKVWCHGCVSNRGWSGAAWIEACHQTWQLEIILGQQWDIYGYVWKWGIPPIIAI